MRKLSLAAIVLSALLAAGGCNSTAGQRDFAAIVIELDGRDMQPTTAPAQAIERRWVSTKLWKFEDDRGRGVDASRLLFVDLAATTPQDEVNVNAFPAPGTPGATGIPGAPRGVYLAGVPQPRPTPVPLQSHRYEIEVHPRDIERPGASDDPAGPVSVAVERPGASFTFTGKLISEPEARQPVYGGIIRVSFYDAFLDAAQQAQRDPTMATLISAALRGVDANDLNRFAALDLKPTIDEIAQLVVAKVSPANVQTLHDAGYRFNVAQLIALTGAGVSIQDAVALREAGFNYTSRQLIRLHEGKVDAMYAIGMKDAGFADGVEQLIRLRKATVPPEFAARVRRLNVAHSDADVVRLFTHDITPESIAGFQAAQYVLSVEQLIRMKEANVRATDAQRLRRAGYNFSLDDLTALARAGVPADFAVSLMSDAFEPLDAGQIVDLHQRRVTTDMVRTLRRPRYAPATAAEK